ncbi:hypothetical protein [Streptococcus koreensis]|jgi:hypothetical protein|uniref:hypothetical protein n=1 Tax=Streptococcus koreensis TaxID=2382163 RepID=UPI002067A68B|nr:hypothetical protein [Streptococcus koreensis]DAN93716.1 MAG TPA: hypothetical protein [Caudoviricetes sp.]DAS80671.1 MAG TPA: hypothetical protein [Caudoviricetes sp.]DAX70009.1 MAG TPA: hypothetical protein [Caudoviricetes sp.]
MNKRIKKKRELYDRLRKSEGAVDYLLDQNNQLWNIVDRLEKISSQNVKVTNSRFDEIEKIIQELKKPRKKSWFGFR